LNELSAKLGRVSRLLLSKYLRNRRKEKGVHSLSQCNGLFGKSYRKSKDAAMDPKDPEGIVSRSFAESLLFLFETIKRLMVAALKIYEA